MSRTPQNCRSGIKNRAIFGTCLRGQRCCSSAFAMLVSLNKNTITQNSHMISTCSAFIRYESKRMQFAIAPGINWTAPADCWRLLELWVQQFCNRRTHWEWGEWGKVFHVTAERHDTVQCLRGLHRDVSCTASCFQRIAWDKTTWCRAAVFGIYKALGKTTSIV